MNPTTELPCDFIELKHEKIKKECYYISEKGDIYSKLSKRILTSQKDRDGYMCIMLREEDGKKKKWFIHTLVALTFIGLPPNDIKDPTIDHINKNRSDNRKENLRWRERAINSSDRAITPKGSKNGRAKLSEKDVLNICKMIKNKKRTINEIATIYDVSPGTIADIKNKNNWKHLTKDFDFEIA